MASNRFASASKWLFTFCSTDTEYLAHGCKTEIIQQTPQSAFGSAQIEVMRQFDSSRQGDSRMLRVEFPGVQIEHRWLAFPVDRTKRQARHRVGEDAEV